MQLRIDKAIRDDGTSFWEAKFPIKKLLQKQRDNPSIFAAQYQNDVEVMRQFAPVKQEWVKGFELTKLQTFGLFNLIAIDPGGISESEETSGMGVWIAGTCTAPGSDFGKIYTLESSCLHGDTWTLAKVIVDLWERYLKPRIVVEEVALQKVFQDIFKKESEQRGHIYFPVEGIKSAELKDKITLARGVTPFFTRGQVFIDQVKHFELYSKLEDYPAQGTDDVNALLIGLHWLKNYWSEVVQTKEKKPMPKMVRSKITRY